MGGTGEEAGERGSGEDGPAGSGQRRRCPDDNPHGWPEQSKQPDEMPVIVSACLMGIRCRYDGESRRDEEVVRRLRGAWAVPVCPEQLGGLPTPRPPSEVVRDSEGGVVDAGERGLRATKRAMAAPSGPLEGPTLRPAQAGTGEEVLEGRARVVDVNGEDKTAQFLRGAEEVLSIARLCGARRAILKTDSPSCDPVRGVTAALLRREGIELESAGCEVEGGS